MRKSRKILCVLMAALLLLGAATPAFALKRYCGPCNAETTWYYCCRRDWQSNGPYQNHMVDGQSCNFFYTYDWTYQKCGTCNNNFYKLDKTHAHYITHTICKSHLTCPY